MTILDKIVAQKKHEVAQAKASVSQAQLEAFPLFSRTGLSLKQRLLHATFPQIIAEFKRRSPSKGIINAEATPEAVALGYQEAGAAGVSVLTDTDFFGGSIEDFAKARAAAVQTPMLRKDFMIDPYQLYEAKAMGADVILLIAACLTPKEVQSLAQLAHQLGLEVLLEVHDAEELAQSLCEEVDIVGVNNRNLKTFTTSIETSRQLAERIPSTFPKISESGLDHAETLVELFELGYTGFLMGESFMKTAHPAEALGALQHALNQTVNYTPPHV